MQLYYKLPKKSPNKMTKLIGLLMLLVVVIMAIYFVISAIHRPDMLEGNLRLFLFFILLLLVPEVFIILWLIFKKNAPKYKFKKFNNVTEQTARVIFNSCFPLHRSSTHEDLIHFPESDTSQSFFIDIFDGKTDLVDQIKNFVTASDPHDNTTAILAELSITMDPDQLEGVSIV